MYDSDDRKKPFRKRKLRFTEAPSASKSATVEKDEAASSSGTTAKSRPVIFVLGGDSPWHTMEYYDFQTKEWEMAGTLPCGISCPAILTYQNKIWMIGGCKNGFETLKTVEVYDPMERKWKQETTKMISERQNHGVVTYDEKLYAIGGRRAEGDYLLIKKIGRGIGDGLFKTIAAFHTSNNTWISLNTLEIYDHINGWKPGTSMRTPKHNFGIAVVRNEIFVVGGCRYYGRPTKSIEVYSIPSDCWGKLNHSIDVRHSRFALVYMDEELYAIGGNRYTTISTCHPRGRWSQIPDSALGRYGFSVVVVDEAVFALGGGEGQDDETNTVQCFTPGTKQLASFHSGMCRKRRPLGAAVIQM